MAQPRTALQNVPLTMAQNVIYCTPVRAARGFVAPPDAVLEGSAVNDANEFDTITVTDGEFVTAAPFIRCTDSGGCVVTFKPFN